MLCARTGRRTWDALCVCKKYAAPAHTSARFVVLYSRACCALLHVALLSSHIPVVVVVVVVVVVIVAVAVVFARGVPRSRPTAARTAFVVPLCIYLL